MTLGPVALHAGNSQVPVSRHEQEMVVNKLLANPLVHSSPGVVLSSKVGREALDGIDHQLLNSNTLLLGDTGRQTKSINRATNTDPARVNRDIRRDVSLDLANIHIRGVPGRGADSVVLLDQGVEHRGEVLVGVPVTSVDTTVLVVEPNSASNGLSKGESRGLGLDSLELLPFILGDILGNKRVLGLNVRERSVCLGSHRLVVAGARG